MSRDRRTDRHAADGKPILVRPTKDQRSELDQAVEIIRAKAPPGSRVSVTSYVLDVALEAARETIRKGR
jgi:uncharacterized protein (DUF1778 family)